MNWLIKDRYNLVEIVGIVIASSMAARRDSGLFETIGIFSVCWGVAVFLTAFIAILAKRNLTITQGEPQ